MGVSHDMSKRKAVEEQIKGLAKFPSENPQPVLRVERDGAILYANKAAVSLLNIGDGKDGWLLPERWQSIAQDALESGANLEEELKHGDHTLSVLFVPISDFRYVNVYVHDITELKQAEEALRESEKSLRLIYDTAGDVLFQLRVEPDDRFRFLSVNQAFLTATGLTEDQIVGKTTEEIIPKPSHALVLGKYKEAIREQRIVRWEESTEYPSGVKIGAVAVAPAFDENGICTHLIGSVHDVTEAKQAEEAMRDREERLQLATKAAKLGIYDWHPLEGKVQWDKQMHKLFGLSLQSTIDRNEYFSSILHPDDTERINAEFGNSMDPNNKETVFQHEFKVLLKKGQIKHIELHALHFRGLNGVVTRFIGTCHDITERKEAEEALRWKNASQQLLQLVAVAANEATNVETALRSVLKEVCAYAEWPIGHVYLPANDSSGQLRPTTIWQLQQPKRFETFKRVTEKTSFDPGVGLPGRVFSTGKPAWITDVTKDTNFPRAKLATDIGVKAGFGFPVLVGTEVVAVLEFFSSVAIEPDEPLLEVMAHVGTQLGRVFERERAEEKLRRYHDNLEELVKERTAQLEAANNELESFSYSVSHDLRAPLRAIDGFGVALLEDYGQQVDEEGRRLIGIMRENATQMGQLIDDLLTFSRLGRQEMKASRIDMTALAKGVFEELKAAAPKKIELKIRRLPSARGDRSLMHHVFLNLIDNAIKYSRLQKAPVIEIDGRSEDGEHIYSISDNGVGFDMKYADKLFAVFQRLHRADEFEGTGVGLALVQRIIVRHGGRVWAEADVGQGATFHFILPTKEAR